MSNIKMAHRSHGARGIKFASYSMIKVILIVSLVAGFFKSTEAQQDRKQREETVPKLSSQLYLKNKTSENVDEQDLALVTTTRANPSANPGGRAHVVDETIFSTSTSSVSSTTNVVTSPTSSSSIELTSPSITQATSFARKQEDSRQLQLNHQTLSNNSTRLLLQLQQRQNQHGKDRDQSNESNQQSTHASQDPFYQASTSQSVTIAEPEMAASNQEQQLQQQQQQQKALQKQQKSSSGGNRWTHFGARLRPLATSGIRDHNEAASKSLPAIVYNGNTGNNNNMQQRSQLKQASSSSPLNTNQVGDGDDDDDLNDDQDSEALLYKMMQQQGFLMGSPLWQQKSGSNQGAQNVDSDGGQLMASGDGRDAVGNSKKVIKLLKSYSHIHQVDDSDDQIRGTYTRLPVRRPAVNDNGWQQADGGQHYNRNRTPNGRHYQQQQPQSSRQQPHIFVSSQPLAKAYSQSSVRNQQPSNGQPDASDSENNPQAGNPQGGPSYGEEGGDSNSQGGPPPEEDEFECPNNGIFADEASGCESYHVCQSGAQVQQKFQCPKGTLFNNIILTCDFAHNVQCNKNKEALRPNDQQSDPQPYPQQQPQQLPRASIQVSQNSYVNQPRAQQQPPNQARWSQQTGAQQGPRHLKIGSQYNQHQQHQQTSQAQAVSAYPHPKQPAASSESDDDSDDDPVVPLTPATVPPRAASSINLPYNPPPVISPSTQLAHQPHQSAHQSQYPNYQQSYQQNERGVGSYDGDSVVSPVFASHDEPIRTTEASTATRSYIDGTTAGQPTSDAQSFNLVINHITPSKQQQAPAKSYAQLKPVANDYNKKPSNHQAKHSQLVPANLPLAAYKKNEPKRQQQAYAIPVNKQVIAVINPNQSAANRDVPKQSARQPMHHQNHRLSSYDNNNNNHYNHNHQQQQQHRQPLATQLKAVHVDAGQPMPLTAALVDLTNDKKSGGVSSEALNDGLLLIVRHDSAPAKSDVSHQRPEANKPYATGKRANNKQPTASGQAYALDPSIVRPNSPVDAQLFPNVQKAIVASQAANNYHYYNHNQQHHPNHQAAQSVHHVQHASAPSIQQSPHSIRVSPPLPPMEPPKPVVSRNEDGHHSNSELQIVASSSHSPSSSPSATTSTVTTSTLSSSSYPTQPQQQQQPSPSSSTSAAPLLSAPATEPSPLPSHIKKVSAQHKADNSKLRAKRTKRLKAAQHPPTLDSSKTPDAKRTQPATNQPLKKELKSKAADQPVSLVVDQQRRTG